MRILIAIALLLSSLPAVPTPARAAAAYPVRPAAPLSPSPQETATPSPAATPSPTPTPDTELDEAKRAALLAEEEKKRLVSEQEAAEARAAKLKAIVQPLGEAKNVTIPTGSVQTDAAGWAETQALSQEAARQITLHMSKALCTGTPAIETVVIYNATDITAMEFHDSIIRQLDVLKDEFDQKHKETVEVLKATDPTAKGTVAVAGSDPTSDKAADGGLLTALAIPGAATGLIKSVAELVNLFRTDTQFVNQNLAISEDMVVSYLADNLRTAQSGCTKKVDIYYPLYMPPKPLSDGNGRELCPNNTRSVIHEVELIGGGRRQAAVDVGEIEKRIAQLEKLGTTVEERKKKTAAKAKKEAEKAEKMKNRRANAKAIKTLEAEIQTLSEEIAKLNKTLGETLEKENPTDEELKTVEQNSGKFKRWTEKLKELKVKTDLLITSTEQMLTKLNTPEEGTKLTALGRLRRAERLQCILDKVGTYTLRVSVTANGTTKIKKNLFVDAKVRHSARAGLVYQLFDKHGMVMNGGTMQCYIDYHSSRNVRDAVSGTGNAMTCLSDADKAVAAAAAAAARDKKKRGREASGQ